MSQDEIQLKVRVPEDLKDLVDADSRNNKEVVKAALWNEFGGRKKSALEAKKQHKEEQMQAIQNEIEAEREDKRRVQQEIEAIQAKIERMDEEEVGTTEFVDGLLDELEDASIQHLVPDVIESREEFGRLDESAEELHELAKERAVEQGRTLRTSHFMSYQEASRHSGMQPLVTEAWGDDGE